MNIYLILEGTILLIWGVIAFVLLMKLDNEKFNPDSKIWKLIRLEDKIGIVPMFWMGFIMLGVFFGIFGIALIIGELF
jgi:hypothetical protein